jgi:von Willebrand factor type A domain-containing protein
MKACCFVLMRVLCERVIAGVRYSDAISMRINSYRARSRSGPRPSGFWFSFAGVALALGCSSGDGEKTSTVSPLSPSGDDGTSAGGASGDTPGPGVIPPAGLGGQSSGDPGLVGLVEGDPVEEEACVDQFAGTAQVPPVLQFVVDTSGSMNWVPGTERFPGSGELSKWEITRDALVTAIAAMPDAAAVGISYYPNTSGAGPACIIPEASAPIARLTPDQRALINRVNASRIPAGGTPTQAAYEFGVQQLQSASIAGSRFLVLITDGIPTYTLDCQGDGQTRVDGAPLVASVEARNLEDGIRTFVIGSPGSEPAHDELSQMALVGGTGPDGCADVQPSTCHFDMTAASDFSAALKGALGDIAEATLGCEYAVPELPPGRTRLDLNDVSVVLESGGSIGTEFVRSSSGECDAGWQYNDDNTSIVLCRSTCEELTRLVSEDPTRVLRVKFGCNVTPD